jgi:primosomal protein N' (replication factor Y)
VLIGTQMMSKGLDFANVGLVGVLHADALFRFPDFRAPERALQLLLQLAGRAGRGKHSGRMLVQTYDPSHPVVQQLAHVHYPSFLTQLLTERQQYRYPPYVRLIRLVVKHREPNLVEAGAAALASEIRSRIGQGVMGPVWALVPRVNNWFHQEILMKLEAGPGLGAAKNKLRESIKAFHGRSDWKAIRLVLDVDP